MLEDDDSDSTENGGGRNSNGSSYDRTSVVQDAAKTSNAFDAERGRQEEVANTQKAALQSHLMYDDIEMGRRHSLQTSRLDADIAKRNDERRHQLEAEQQRLEQQLASDGWRKLMRDLLGKTRRDTEELEATRLNLENIRMREAQERQALQAQQEAERQARSQAAQQRKQAYDLKLEQDRQEALRQAAQADKPTPQPQPTNDRLTPSWRRTEAPEQDNRAPGAQDFQKAAQATPERAQAVEQHKARIRERLRQDRERGRDGHEYD